MTSQSDDIALFRCILCSFDRGIAHIPGYQLGAANGNARSTNIITKGSSIHLLNLWLIIVYLDGLLFFQCLLLEH